VELRRGGIHISLTQCSARGDPDRRTDQRDAEGRSAEGLPGPSQLPLDDGGTNAHSNLILEKNEPFHKVLTSAHASATRGTLSGEMRMIDVPIPGGIIYP
jgi:hypothetical protein